MIIKSMNYEIATETDSQVFLDADRFISRVPDSILTMIEAAQTRGDHYISIDNDDSFEYYGEMVLEISWG